MDNNFLMYHATFPQNQLHSSMLCPFSKVLGHNPVLVVVDIKFFYTGPCLTNPLPLDDLRKIDFTCYCNKKHITCIIVTNGNHCVMTEKNMPILGEVFMGMGA